MDVRHLLLAWGLLGTVIAAFAVGVWLPLADVATQNRTEIEDLRARLAKIQGLETTQLALKAQIEQLRAVPGEDEGGRLFSAKSTALGTADLQRRVQSVLAKNAAQQLSSQPLKSTVMDDFHRLELTVTVAANLSTLQAVLNEFETGEPQIFVNQLLITSRASSRSNARSRRRSRNAQAQTPSDELSARLTVSGYMPANGETGEIEPTR